jgi:hypothetical protein
VFDFRYHLASLVAVVVMLGVGLLLGAAVADRGTIERQRATLFRSIQQDLTEAKKANDSLKTDVSRNQAFASASTDALTKGALTGRTVAIVVNEGDNPGLAAATGVLRNAGAKVAVVRIPDAQFGLGADVQLLDRIGTVVGSTGTTADVASAVGKALAAEWAGSAGLGKGPVSEALTAAGKLNISDVTPGVPVNGVVLMAAFKGDSEPALVALTERAASAGVIAAAAQARASDVDVVGPAAAAGVSTVNDVDAPSGGYSLVEILAGKAKGRFGTGLGADQAFPPITVGP